MNVVSRVSSLEYTSDQAEQDRMARNRQGTTPTVTLAPTPDPMTTPAFRVAALRQGVATLERAVVRAKGVLDAAMGKAARDGVQRGLRLASGKLATARAKLAAEERGEQAAPAVQREEIGADVVLREPRVMLPDGARPVLVFPPDRLFARRSIDAKQLAAARRYRRAYEAAHRDAYPISMGESTGGVAPGSGNRRIEEPVGASAELARMRAVLPPRMLNLVEHVVVHEGTIEAWAARQVTPKGRPMGAEAALGLFTGALDVLDGVR